VTELPTGTVTFLLTDLETSTRLWEELPDAAMGAASARHDAILRAAIDSNRGFVVTTTGDGIAAAFASAPDALAAAIEAQLALAGDADVARASLNARMGLHTDEARMRAEGEYVNRPINRCSRLMSAAHGGQIVVSGATAAVVQSALPDGVSLVDLGAHRLRDLADAVQVYQVVHPQLRADFPPLRSLDAAPGNLPRQLTSFVGREAEMKHVTELLRERALVTLTGVGGVGKTRLALQIAADVALEFRDGAWLCELGPLTDGDAIWDLLATSLGAPRAPGRAVEEGVLDYLSHKHLLLVLDNCEHLLNAVAAVVGAIAQRGPRVALLATSREGLAIGGEQLVAVPALPVPDIGLSLDALESSNADAVRLFCDRAQDAKPDFSLADTNIAAVTELCRRLDGIPLALELAAARVRSLTPDELVARLDQRFRLLTRGSRAGLERHQTLRNTIDWSYNLLTGDEQLALNRLSVFSGGCDVAAAVAVLSIDGSTDELDAIDLISQLVDKSLVLVEESVGATRFRLLETIRQYAQERLEASGETADVRRAHAEYYVDLAQTAGPYLRGPEQLQWSTALVRDAENLRAALDWAVEESSADHALRLVAPLMITGIAIGWTATDWAETAQNVDGAQDHDLYPIAVAFAAMGATMRGDLDKGREFVGRALEAQARLGTEHLWVHAAAGTLGFFSGDLDAATEHATRWHEAAVERDDVYEIAHASVLLATGLHERDPERGCEVAVEAVKVARDGGIKSALLYAIMTLTNYPVSEQEAIVLLDEASVVAAQLGDRQGAASIVAFRAVTLSRLGEWPAALFGFIRALQQQFEITGAVFPGVLFGPVDCFANLDDPEAAALALGFADAHAGRDMLWGQARTQFAEVENAVREALGEDEYWRLRAEGARHELGSYLMWLSEYAERVHGQYAT
jgi:predicted ATPase/class 3 adenylate cyclase